MIPTDEKTIERLYHALSRIVNLPVPATPKDYETRGADAFTVEARTLMHAQNIAREALYPEGKE